ncbi:GRASP55/65 PDZ-like domain-containing protein [Globomyces pollinis-pini]|nr:GRASP55/65 PDZ-like domain-containing protein [Globomyces pollinis-pini]
MGQETSQLEGSSLGYHVVRASKLAENAGIEPYFDYITHAKGQRLDDDPTYLKRIIEEHSGRLLPLIVYNSKTMALRNVSVVPVENGGLNSTVKLCDFRDAHERVWHVLEVSKDSPASSAGLIAFKDYILGSPNVLLNDNNDFADLIQVNQNKPLSLYVYNTDMDVVREVVIVPDSNWGGLGSLGCEIGYGFSHRIALSKTESALSNRTISKPTTVMEKKENKNSHQNSNSAEGAVDPPDTHNHHDHGHVCDHTHDHSHTHATPSNPQSKVENLSTLKHEHSPTLEDHSHDRSIHSNGQSAVEKLTTHKHQHSPPKLGDHDHDHDHNHSHDHDHSTHSKPQAKAEKSSAHKHQHSPKLEPSNDITSEELTNPILKEQSLSYTLKNPHSLSK